MSEPAVDNLHFTWIERVRAADAEAEAAWQHTSDMHNDDEPAALQDAAAALVAIAAELRAQRISRRPGAGQIPGTGQVGC